MEEEVVIEEIDINDNSDKLNYFKFIINAIIKPYESFKKYNNDINYQQLGIISGIIILFFTILRVFKEVLNTVVIKKYLGLDFVIKLENASNINYIKVVFLGIIFMALLLLFISGCYFVSALILKKKIKYERLLLLASITILPFSISYFFLFPIFSLISSVLGIIFIVIGIAYSLVTLITISNELLAIDNKNKKILINSLIVFMISILSILIIYEIDLKQIINNIKMIIS